MNDFTILRSTKVEEPERDYAVLGLRDIQVRFVTKVRIPAERVACGSTMTQAELIQLIW